MKKQMLALVLLIAGASAFAQETFPNKFVGQTINLSPNYFIATCTNASTGDKFSLFYHVAGSYKGQFIAYDHNAKKYYHQENRGVQVHRRVEQAVYLLQDMENKYVNFFIWVTVQSKPARATAFIDSVSHTRAHTLEHVAGIRQNDNQSIC